MQVTCPFAEEQSMVQFASRLAQFIHPSMVFTFQGELGSGKTTMVRAILRALHVSGPIKSPTYSLVESYVVSDNLSLHHFDLYRVADTSELDYMGFRDYFTPDAVCLIEWPECASRYLGEVDINVVLQFEGQGRLAHLSATTSVGHNVLTNWVDPA